MLYHLILAVPEQIKTIFLDARRYYFNLMVIQKNLAIREGLKLYIYGRTLSHWKIVQCMNYVQENASQKCIGVA